MDNTPKVDELFMSMAPQSEPTEEVIPTEEVVPTEDPLEELVEVIKEGEAPEVEEEPQTQPEKVDDDLPVEGDAIVSDWDDVSDNEDTVLGEGAEVYTEIGKAIGIEADSKEKIVNEFETIKSENEQLKAQIEQGSNQFEGVPEDLKKAIELAKSGGDYLEYLGLAEVDYSAISDDELIISQVRAHFPEGEEGDNEVADFLDTMSAPEKRIKAGQLRQALNEEKEAAKQERIDRIQAQKDKDAKFVEAEKERLRAAVNGMESISEFKLTKAHKNRIFDDISNGKITEKLFGVSTKGSTDYNKMAETYFKAVYFDKIVSYMKSKTASESKKKVLEETSNANLSVNGSIATPSEKSGLDLLINSFK